METIAKQLLKNRPSLSPNTVRSYGSIIRNLYIKCLEGDSIPRVIKADPVLEFFKNNYKRVLKQLEDTSFSKRKTLLAALLAFVGAEHPAGEAYRKQMILDADAYNAEQKKQKKSDAEEENWITQEEVMKKLGELERQTKHLFTKQNLTMNELQQLQNYVILAVYTMIPPRRLLDYTVFKLRDINKDKDNYMEGNKFVFNRYKTDSKYGRQVVNIPIKLRYIIQRWAKKHNNDYLFFSEVNTPIAQSRMTQKLNKIFGKNISVNMLRHIFITDNVLAATPALMKLEKVAKDMGHSVDTQQLYKKVD